jgi:LPS sulfotransferase NodH
MPIGLQRGYAICTAPRSGSNLLCQYLTSTELLGRPLEYFNTQGRRAIDDPAYPDAPSDQIRLILTRGATANGIYGVKLFWYQHMEVTSTLDWTLALPNLSYIYLERRDRLGQAFSWARAMQTSQYRSTQPVNGEPSYDAAAIRQRLHDVEREYAQWAAFFAHRKIMPLSLVYEDFIAEPQSAIDRVAQMLAVRISPKIVPGQIDLTIQRDAITEEWRARFLREEGRA